MSDFEKTFLAAVAAQLGLTAEEVYACQYPDRGISPDTKEKTMNKMHPNRQIIADLTDLTEQAGKTADAASALNPADPNAMKTIIEQMARTQLGILSATQAMAALAYPLSVGTPKSGAGE